MKQEKSKFCADCDRSIEGKYVRYCDGCRAKRRVKKLKRIFNSQMDEVIRRTYIEKRDKRESPIPSLKELARRWRMPHSAVKQRAAQLGLRRARTNEWTQSEAELLEKYAHLPSAAIAKKLLNKGFKRTPTAVQLKIKRLHIRRRAENEHYSARGLADCFGVDCHSVLSWIRQDILKAEIIETDAAGRNFYAIREPSVLSFILENPLKFDLRKVDQLWFLDLITNGKIAPGIKIKNL